MVESYLHGMESIYATIINPHTNSTSNLGGHNTGVTAVRFSPDGKYALSVNKLAYKNLEAIFI